MPGTDDQYHTHRGELMDALNEANKRHINASEHFKHAERDLLDAERECRQIAAALNAFDAEHSCAG